MNKIIPFLVAAAFLGPSIAYGDVYFFHVMALVTVLALCLKPKLLVEVVKFNWRENKEWIFILSYSILSYFWATNVSDYLKYNAYLLCGYTILFIVPYFLQDQSTYEKSWRILSGLYIGHLVISFLEIFTRFRWPISNYSIHNDWFGRENYVFPDYFENYPTSFFWHQNETALITLVCLPFIFRSRHRLKPVILTCSYVVIFLSGTKSMVIYSLVYGAYKLFFKADRKKILRSLSYVGAVLCVLAPLAYYLSNDMQKAELVQATETLKGYATPAGDFLTAKINNKPFDFSLLHENIRERYYFMDGALEQLKCSPILGIGAGGHLSVVHRVNETDVPLKSLHFYWLEFLMLYGPVLTAVYVFWLFRMIRRKTTFSEALILYILGVPVIATGIYILPSWLLYALCNGTSANSKNRLTTHA